MFAVRARCAILLALTLSLSARSVRAADPPPPPSKRALAAGTAIVPGVLVHGSGSYVLGKKQTAAKLAIAGGAGLALAVTGVTLAALTGASRRFVTPIAVMGVTGVGLFTSSFASDLYSVLAPEGGLGEALPVAPRYETRAGIFAVSDPVFGHHALVDERVDVRLGWFRLSGVGQFAPGSTSRRIRAEAAARFGGTPATHLDLEVATTDHAYLREGFGSLLFEASLRGRYGLAQLDDGLRGAFVEGQLGGGIFRDRYAIAASDVGDLLLARFAWGMYLGRGGEALLFYDHRRDGYAGGLKPNGIGAGYLGSVGASTRIPIAGPWGIGADVQAGSALLGGVSILFRSEGP